jgi:hypothetical protein
MTNFNHDQDTGPEPVPGRGHRDDRAAWPDVRGDEGEVTAS